jgi:hypothetical protein
LKTFLFSFHPIKGIDLSVGFNLNIKKNIKNIIFEMEKRNRKVSSKHATFDIVNELFKNNNTIQNYLFKNISIKSFSNIINNNSIKYFNYHHHFQYELKEEKILNIINNNSIKKLKLSTFDFAISNIKSELIFSELMKNKSIIDLTLDFNFEDFEFKYLSNYLINNKNIIKFEYNSKNYHL